MGIRRWCLAIVSTLAFTASVASAQQVAVFGSPSETAWNVEVQTKLLDTGQFATVDEVLIDAVTPPLAQLQAYDAVLVYSDLGFANPAALGNALADYLDAGGGVVLCTFAYYPPGNDLGVGGRLAADGYLPFTTDNQSDGAGLQLVADLPGHPLLAGVGSFDGGASSFHNSNIATVNGATQVAHWSNGQPLVATMTPSAGTIVGLNFYPPSSDSRSDFWLASTDGDRLMANALLHAAGQAPSDLDGDGYTTAQGDCDDGDASIHPGAQEDCNDGNRSRRYLLTGDVDPAYRRA